MAQPIQSFLLKNRVRKVKGYSHLFNPGKIGHLTLKNRIIMAPIDTNLADAEGNVTEEMLKFYEKRAQGGVAMIIVENSQVDFPRGKNTIRQLSIHEDGKVEKLLRLSNAIHQGGALAAIQIHHAGRETTLEITQGIMPVAPSPIPCGHLKTPVRELAVSEIEEIIEMFINAAERAMRAGFDLVEIHGAHGYLVGQFLSPYSNKRTDKYGGDLCRRMRFPIAILRGIKERLGKEYPLSFRFSADEFVQGGIDLSDSINIVKTLEEEGIDAIHVSCGIYESLPTLLEPISYPQGWRSYLSKAIKQVVKIPVITVGVIREPEFADDLLKQKVADFVAIGRGLLADPEWAKKAENRKSDEILKCIGCNEGCLGQRLIHPIQCSLNPVTGHEAKFGVLSSDRNKKRIVVVGGGPAGLETARVAALRGHEVTLVEKEDCIGGQLRAAAIPPGKEKIRWLMEFYDVQLKRLGVRILFGVEANELLLDEMSPNVVILATGSTVELPEWENRGVPIFLPEEVLLELCKLPGLKGSVIGGGSTGCEVALFLKKKGFDVEIFEQFGDILLDIEPISKWDLKERLEKENIKIHLNTKILRIENRRLFFRRLNPESMDILTDFCVYAGGRRPNQFLYQKLEIRQVPYKIYLTGDAMKPGKIHNAIHQSYELARTL